MFYFICVKPITLSFNKDFLHTNIQISTAFTYYYWIKFAFCHRDSATSCTDTWFLFSVYRFTSQTPHLPKSDALHRNRQTGVPGIFLQVLLMQSVLVYHQAAFQPSEEDETVAPFVFNCGWLGHGKNSVGGSSLTFLREHHKKTTPGKQWLGPSRCPRLNNNERHQTPDKCTFQMNLLDIKHVLHIFLFDVFFFLTVQRRDQLQNTAEGCGMRSHTKRDLLHNILALFCVLALQRFTLFLCTHKHAARLHEEFTEGTIHCLAWRHPWATVTFDMHVYRLKKLTWLAG